MARRPWREPSAAIACVKASRTRPRRTRRYLLIGTSSTGSASGIRSEICVTDSGGAVNLAHRIRLPGSEELNGFSEVQRQAPSDVRRTLYFRLFGKSTNWKF